MSRYARLLGITAVLLGTATSARPRPGGTYREAFTAAQPGSHVASEREIDITHHLADKHTIEYPVLEAELYLRGVTASVRAGPGRAAAD